MALGFDTVTALIEVQALGRVTARPAERRKLTRSDAAICVDFVNALMAELAAEMAEVEGYGPLGAYRYATHLDDARPLVLMLEDRAYRSLSFDLRFGGAETRDGRILIALPQRPGARAPEPRPAEAAPDAAPAGATLAEAVTGAPVEVVGVLCRRTLTLGELRALLPGRLLPLPRVTLAEARLETRDGQLLAMGKLGESEGCHALRLQDPALSAAEKAAVMLSPPPVPRPAPLPADLSDADPFRAARDRSEGTGTAAAGRAAGA